MKLNLGCGKDKREGYVNIDISPIFKPDMVYDLNTGIPLNCRNVSEILCYHYLEHTDDIIFQMNEIYRVCDNKAVVDIRVPDYRDPFAIADPTHKRLFNEHSFDYFCSNCDHYWIHEAYGIVCNYTKLFLEMEIPGEARLIIHVKLLVVK